MQTPKILLCALRQTNFGQHLDHETTCQVVNKLIAKIGQLNSQMPQSINPMIEMICSVVAVKFGVTVPWFMSKKRTTMRSRCRSLAMAICNEKTVFSVAEIAEQFCLDYSTTVKAIRKGRLDPEFESFL